MRVHLVVEGSDTRYVDLGHRYRCKCCIELEEAKVEAVRKLNYIIEDCKKGLEVVDGWPKNRSVNV